ncbi:MAG: DUF695 domain-containing protein [Muribaculaceae bacterium]|nr:DUF695 domain-containing protein [Muribaculaceae bacterium]
MPQPQNNQTDYPGQWETAIADGESGKVVFVTGRRDVDKFRNNKRYSIRITVDIKYKDTPSGLPDNEDALMLMEVTDRLVDVFHKDPVAVLTGIYTGDGQRTLVFYTASTHIFQRKFNEALEDLPVLPISIAAENDPEWEEYAEMLLV